MNQSEDQVVDKAILFLKQRNTFKNDGSEYKILHLFPRAAWRMINEDWWNKKEAYVMGADVRGNLFLRVCDGTVRYLDCKTQIDKILAPSVRYFLLNLEPE